MVLWTDYLALGLLALVLVVIRLRGRGLGQVLPRRLVQAFRVLEVMVLLLVVGLVLLAQGQ
jgi:hypothetical protein